MGTKTMSNNPTHGLADDEPILADDYPVFASYFYVADGKVIRSPLQGNVRDLRREFKAVEIRRCAAVRRGLFK
jgi:hypothetical protein